MMTQSGFATNNRLPPIPGLEIVVAYDDFASGQFASELCNEFIAKWRESFMFHVKMWTFDLLRNLTVNANAAEQTAAAQIVVVSTSAADLPPAVKKWIEAWVVRKGGRPGVLVGVLNSEATAGSRAKDYLKTAAASSGLEFVLGGRDCSVNWNVFHPPAILQPALN